MEPLSEEKSSPTSPGRPSSAEMRSGCCNPAPKPLLSSPQWLAILSEILKLPSSLESTGEMASFGRTNGSPLETSPPAATATSPWFGRSSTSATCAPNKASSAADSAESTVRAALSSPP